MENENWEQPQENQSQPGAYQQQQPEKKSFFQQEQLQRTWLNVKLATWLKCFIVIAVLIVAAAFIAPKLSTAQSQQEQGVSNYYECEEDYWSDDYYEDSDDYYYED